LREADLENFTQVRFVVDHRNAGPIVLCHALYFRFPA
jgi:hypothetical protein